MIRSLLTERLILRGYRESDRAAFVALNTDPVVRLHMDGAHSPASAEALFSQILSAATMDHGQSWAVTLSRDVLYVGHVYLHREVPDQPMEIGVVIGREFWGQGFGPEALRAVIDYAFVVMSAEQVIATVDADHPRSIRALEKVGMRFDRETFDELGKYLVYSTRDPGHR